MTYEEIVQSWQRKTIQTEADINRELHSFRILFAYHSGKIENDEIDYYDTREIFENGRISSFTGNVRTLFEQQNQRDCYEILRPKITKKEPISIELIKLIHFELTKGTYDERRYLVNEERPGEFKKHDYVVGRHEVGTDVANVEKELKELVEEINTIDKTNYLKIAAYLHAVFENIHPFADGNGRVGRTLMNYYLVINNHPPIIIYEEDRKSYYAALEAFDTEEKLEPLTNFLKKECEKTWRKK